MKKFRKIISKMVMMAMFIGSIFVPHQDVDASSTVALGGEAHVQDYGDTAGKVVLEDGIETLVLGTRGQSKRVEQVIINFENNTGYEGDMEYRVHRQDYGWTGWVQSGEAAGTTGQSKRLEAIEIRLTGELAKEYDVRYSAHAQDYGDAQGWVYNGALAGTTGESKRLEEIKVQIIPKGMINEQHVSYRVHRQDYGWEKTWSSDGDVSGTTGQSKRLEGITIDIKGNVCDGGITYRTHVQDYGWMDWVSNGTMSGTQGKAKRLEAIEIKLTGRLAEEYDVYYRVHAQNFGWMGWAKNGEAAGTSGYSYRLEAIQIVLVEKDSNAPTNTYKGVAQDNPTEYSSKSETGTAPTVPTAPPTVAEPIKHEARFGTYSVLKCGDCNGIFHNEEDLKLHYAEWTDDQCKGETQPIVETHEYLIQAAYTEYSEKGETVVPPVYEMQWVVDEKSYIDYDVPVLKERKYEMCNQCKKRFYHDENVTNEMLGDHLEFSDCMSISGTYTDYEQIGVEDVTHPELGHWESVEIEEGYTK
ncbi:MAG: hypothetical protein IJX85_12430 [Lachnospiraceae bacterium]|nr:hypothetical protein [Lachnospiraceae bacterium]